MPERRLVKHSDIELTVILANARATGGTPLDMDKLSRDIAEAMERRRDPVFQAAIDGLRRRDETPKGPESYDW